MRERLQSRGIDFTDDQYGAEISLRLEGLAWIFNYFHLSGNVGKALGKSTLPKIASFNPPKNELREFRLKATTLPAYNELHPYHLLVCYLNGTPPRAVSPVIGCYELSGRMRLDRDSLRVFKVGISSVVDIELTDKQISALKKGETLIISDYK